MALIYLWYTFAQKKLFRMKNKIFFILILASFALASCMPSRYEVFEGFAQGTTFRMVYKSPKNFNDTINGMLLHFDNILSLYNENSMISKINRNEEVLPDKLFSEFFEKSKQVHDQSVGYFDITVFPLVSAWGFGPDKKQSMDTKSIDSIMAFIGMDKIKMENGRLVKSDSRIKIDGNAIAQGQSVDYVSKFLESKGVEHYMVEIGGEVRAKGLNDKGTAWRIGIDKPIDGSNEENRELQAIIQLTDKSLATSGNYRKFQLVDGVKYSHSINPKTGYPAKNRLLSATVIADECSIADAWATAFMVMGLDKALSVSSKVEGLAVYFIYSGNSGELLEYFCQEFEKYIVK
jgi:FAD:protein FMN transferase